MQLGLEGKTAIVVGGSRGIGKAIATGLAREGVDVAIIARSRDQLETTARELQAETARKVVPLVADVTVRQQVDSAVTKAADLLGKLNILVNSGSVPVGKAGGSIESIVDDDFLDDFNVKYLGALRCARAAIPHLVDQRWGRIINISGNSARIAGNLSAGARNTPLVHLTKTLAGQLGRYGITVNCIHPGATRTERTPGVLAKRARELGIPPVEVEQRDYAHDSPSGNSIGRMVEATEIADCAVFLASDRASAITGGVVMVDGGVGQAVYY